MRCFEFSGNIGVEADAMNAWLRLCRNKDEARRVFDVVFRVQNRDLPYHNTHHLQKCWDFIFRSRAPRRVKDIAAAIILFHDLVYVPGSGHNEEHSARAFLSLSKRSGVHKRISDEIGMGIGCTTHVDTSRYVCRIQNDLAINLACDADLISLASPPDIFADNSRKIAEELGASQSGPKFEAARANALIKFLPSKNNPSVYLTKWASPYEDAALANLELAMSVAR